MLWVALVPGVLVGLLLAGVGVGFNPLCAHALVCHDIEFTDSLYKNV